MRVFLMALGVFAALCTTAISASTSGGSDQRKAMNVVADANATPEVVASGLVAPDADVPSRQDPDHKNRRALDAREQREGFGRGPADDIREFRRDPDEISNNPENP